MEREREREMEREMERERERERWRERGREGVYICFERIIARPVGGHFIHCVQISPVLPSVSSR